MNRTGNKPRKSSRLLMAGRILALLLLASLAASLAPADAHAADVRVTVELGPSGARSDGARWQLVRLGGWGCGYWESNWKSSGQTVGKSAPWYGCQFEIRFKDIDGWTAPATESLGSLSPGNYSYGRFDYTQAADSVRITASISPPEAIAAGAKWRVVREDYNMCGAFISPPQNSGDIYTFTTSMDCRYHIVYETITGWYTPPDSTSFVRSPEPNVYDAGTGVYELIPVETKFTINIDPAGARAAGAQWRVVRQASPGCTEYPFDWQAPGAEFSIPGLSDCNYIIEFSDVTGWAKPPNIGPLNCPSALATYDLNAYAHEYVFLPFETAFVATLEPAAARAAGAKWQIKRSGAGCPAVTSPALDSGARYAFAGINTVCDYQVTFKDIDGFETPPDMSLSGVPASFTDYPLTAVYQPNVVKVKVKIEPDGAIADGAQWRISRVASTGCPAETSAWLNSLDTYTFAPTTQTCEYAIELADAGDWTKPTTSNVFYAPSADTYEITYRYDAPVGALCDDFNDGSLNAKWRFTDQTGTSTYPATVEETDGILRISARGSSQWGSTDEYATAYQTQIEGDFEAVVRVMNNTTSATYGKCGILARNDMTAPNSARGYCFAGIADYYGYAFYRDANQDGKMDTNQFSGDGAVPAWLKLVRKGYVFSAYYSVDGASWTKIGNDQTLTQAASKMDVGLHVVSYNDSAYKTTEFDDFCITEPDYLVDFTGYIEPAGARTDGRWRLFNRDTGAWETDWRSNNSTVQVHANAYYDIHWSLVDGFIPPSPNPTPSFQVPQAGNTATGVYSLIPVTTSTTVATTSSTSSTSTSSSSSTSSTTTTTLPGWLCMDISDTPQETQLQAAPANIMFVLDDSGSMDWEMMTSEGDGVFSGYYYNFSMSDNVFGSVLSDKTRWQAQWSGYNRMYYNPGAQYDPWPLYGPADPNTPRSNPVAAAPTLSLAATYLTVNLEFLVDELDDAPDFTSVLTNGAVWGATTNSQAQVGDHYYYANAVGDYTAIWTPTGIPDGDYLLYVNWVESSSRTTNAVYTINYDGGSKNSAAYNQRDDGGVWQPLTASDGTTIFHFSGDASENVTLTHYVSNTSNDKICADAVKWVPASGSTLVDVKNAHYYVYSSSENTYYLVNLNGTIEYYKFSNPGTTRVNEAGLMRDYDPPADIKGYDKFGNERSYTAELQNFANWFTYYRRRELAAKAAVGSVINGLQGVQIGLYSINSTNSSRLRIGVEKVKVTESGVYTDNTNSLLTALYANPSSGGTPLRRGLQAVGEYYSETRSGASSWNATWPYAATAAGGDCQQSFAIAMTDGYWNGSDPGVGNQDGTEGAPFADSYSNTLADVAMAYYKNDLSSSHADLVPTSFTDLVTYQHMVTYGVSFGVTGTLNQEDYDLYNSAVADRVYPTWPDPFASDRAKIDDLWHASVNGRGRFLAASNPAELVDSLQALLQNVISRIGSGASVSVNGDELHAGNTVYQSSYSADGWTGDLKAYSMDSATAEVDKDISLWSLRDWVNDADWDADRVIATYTGAAGVPFRWGSITGYQQSLLSTESRLNYVRGDASFEEHNGGTLRDRLHKLGDLVHSAPKFYHDSLYVGGNDGMLHAVDASNGSERWAYVPNQVFHNLHLLSDPNYDHNFFVDLTPTIRNVGGRDILVGGLGKGGKGYFAIDITGSSTLTTETALAGRVLWEFPRNSTSSSDIADLGYSFSKPWIIKTTAGPAVIFGNGYSCDNQSAVLFILDVMSGNVIAKIDTQSSGDCNGLSTPNAVDVDFDGVADYIYAGDLKGNLWKFDITGNPSSWGVANGTSTPLFTAKGPGGTTQPITSMPVAAFHCDYNAEGLIVVFATGKYLGAADFANSDTQTVYGIWDFGNDPGDYLGTFDNVSGTVSNQTAPLMEQTELAYVNGLRVMSDNAFDWQSWDYGDPDDPNDNVLVPAHLGWYFNLPLDKERVVTDLILAGEVVTVISTIPKDSPCSAGGQSMIMYLNVCQGSPQDLIFDVNNDLILDDTDMVEVTLPSGETVMMPPAGIAKNGVVYQPVSITLDLESPFGTPSGDDDDDDDDDDDSAPPTPDPFYGMWNSSQRDLQTGLATHAGATGIAASAADLFNASDSSMTRVPRKAEIVGMVFWMEVE